ncbi:MAG: S8 family serine peptidase [Planctomycetota bacterium]
MLRSPFLTLLGASAVTASASAQQVESTPPSSPTVTPVTAVDVSANASRQTDQATDEEAPQRPQLVQNDAEPVVVVPLPVTDDSVPLPNPAVVDVIDGVDVETSPASGDPFFLGFVGSDYYPPANEVLDPALVTAAQLPYLDLRNEAVTYGFVMFSKRITPNRLAVLEDMGIRVLGFHPHYTMRAAIPTDRVGDVSVLDFVRWVGVARAQQKVHPATAGEIAELASGERAQLYVSVFESDLNDASTSMVVGAASTVDGDGIVRSGDNAGNVVWQSNGWMHYALQELGAEIVSYAPRQNAFQALVDPARIEDIIARDFVQFVEPVPTAETTMAPVPHDESTAMIMSDSVRGQLDGGTNQVAIVGVVDSGIEVSHQDLGIWGVGWNCTTQTSPWDDIDNGGSGHGTHVAGSILGRGNAEADHLGNAPGLGSWGGASRVFNYRRFPNPCSVSLTTITSTFGNSYDDGTNVTERPHVINNSWGSFYTNGMQAVGSEFECRVVDDAAFDQDQLWVWSAGNSGPNASTLAIEASAKNALTLGNVVDYATTVGDPGTIWTSSSRGPAGDNRWKPNLMAPGRFIRSCLANDNDGYANYSGTSMAAPHATAAAAMLVDGYSFFRYQPARLYAHLMATAMTKDNQIISTPGSSHLGTYGAGRVNVYKAAYNLGGNTWLNWGTSLNGSWAFGNFDVPVGTTRIVAVMTSLEESASAGASQALVNDYDFYLDRDPIDPAGNVGEYFAQQSAIDNSEIRIINNPPSGPWRWKVWPDSVSSETKIGVTVYFIIDDTTPDATFTVTASDQYIQPNDPVDVSANLDVDDYVASAVTLDRSGSFATILGSSTTLRDGVVTDLTDNPSGGNDIMLGDVSDLFSRTGTWTVRYSTQGVKTFGVEARSDNMVDQNASVNITVDGTDPGLVTNLGSPSHTVGQWSNDPTIQWTWTAATDNLSGIQGYGIYENTSASLPGQTLDIGPVTSFTSAAYPSSNSPRYFNIRSVDRSDNWDAQFASTGPYFIDTTLPTAPPSIQSTTHPVGSTRCEQRITVRWNAASDAHSGVQGYGIFWSPSPTSNPGNVLDTTSRQDTEILAPGTWYLHVKTVDVAGNWSTAVAHFGPFRISDECGSNYCSTNANSSGLPGRMSATGSDDASDNDLRVEASQLPTNTVGFFLASATSGFVANPGGSQGNLCLGGGVGRYSNTVLNSGATGSFGLNLDLTAVPTPTGSISITAGMTYHWQAWFRDANPGVTSNLTDGVRILFY